MVHPGEEINAMVTRAGSGALSSPLTLARAVSTRHALHLVMRSDEGLYGYDP